MAPDIIRRVVAEGIPRDVLINVNFPDCRPEEVKRIAVTAQGRRAAGAAAYRSAPGRPRQSLLLDRLCASGLVPGASTAPISRRSTSDCIAVTPLRLDMTDEPYMTQLAELFDEGRSSAGARLTAASIACASASTWNGFCNVGVARYGSGTPRWP